MNGGVYRQNDLAVVESDENAAAVAAAQWRTGIPVAVGMAVVVGVAVGMIVIAVVLVDRLVGLQSRCTLDIHAGRQSQEQQENG